MLIKTQQNLTDNYKNSMFLDPITENELENELKNMDPIKSPGYDDLSTKNNTAKCKRNF